MRTAPLGGLTQTGHTAVDHDNLTVNHGGLEGVTANQHHAQSHADAAHSDGPNAKAGGGAIASLTNSLATQTTDGTLEDIAGIGTVSVPAVERNLSELNAKIDAILTALRAATLIDT